MDFDYKLTTIIEHMDINKKSAKQVALQLDFTKQFEIAEIKKILDKLTSEGKLIKVKDLYSKTAKTLFRGVLRGNKRNFAFLIREDGGADLFVPKKSLCGAQHGDTVAVSIVKGDEAKVEKIFERGITRLVGVFEKHDYFGFVVPDGNSYYSDIKISNNDSMTAKHNDKVVVEITDFSGAKLRGKVVDVIGNADKVESTVLSILKSYEFFNEFPEEAEKEAERMSYKSTANREIFKDLMTITIDGDDSKDFDDAISLVKDGTNYKLYVHIADVSHYVEPNSVLDKEAYMRCTSVYFPGSVYPMLPQVLSNGLCSLNEGEDRLTLTCIMDINSGGGVTNSRIVKGIINSNHRMTYNNVTKILQGDKDLCEQYASIVGLLNNMNDLATILNKRRQVRGNIDLVTVESRIILDENGEVVDIKEYPYTVSNGIIEELMLIANETVAEFAIKHELPFVYRVHDKPDKDKMNDLRGFLDGVGLKLPGGDIKPVDLQQLLHSIKGESVEQVINKVILRSMQKAKYETVCKGHFGLASQYYCHFTSPIRRYPDLQIHRMLKEFIDGKNVRSSKNTKWCEEVSVKSSEREVASERAEREIEDYYKAVYMSKHVGERFEGIISGVTSFGVFVELQNTCEGLARLDNLPKDNYNFIEERYLLKGIKHSYSLGQSVVIEVIQVDTSSNRVVFTIIEEPLYRG